MLDMTLNLITGSWSASPAINITVFHGPSAPDFVDDVITFAGTSYLIYQDTVYKVDSGNNQVVDSCHTRDSVPWNIFHGAPLQITASTELAHPKAYFFKGVRYYMYNLVSREVYFGGVLIDER